MQDFTSVSPQDPKPSKRRTLRAFFAQKKVSFIAFAIVGFLIAITTTWLFDHRLVINILCQLQIWHKALKGWLEVPQFNHPFYLYLPTLILSVISWGLIKLSPDPKPWSRRIAVVLLLALSIRYFLWRVLFTLTLSSWVNGVFSLGLLFLETVMISNNLIYLYLNWTVKDRKTEADHYSKRVIQGKYNPSVDILIPTYNEPIFVLKKTIIGCQSLDYLHKKVYVLDDTNRPEIKKLADDLGCHYITRVDNSHAKAGNLNNAIEQTQGELIAIFDADFIPTKNFLTRTVGFFQKSKMALVQTPQNFYNIDPITRNLGLAHILNSEEEVFYRHVQLLKDGANSVLCAGTSFLVRRSYLQEVGNFVTESISEDYYTGIRLAAQGYETVYLNEKLSAGLAAETVRDHVSQRLRWSRGTLQGLFIKSNPLTIPGLTFKQRLANLEGLIFWLTIFFRGFFLILPAIYILFNIFPIKLSTNELIYIFLPYYFTQLLLFNWLNLYSRSLLFSELYSVVSCFPLALNVINVLMRPFGQGFKVTPKGIARKYYQYDWKLASPVIGIFIISLISLIMTLTTIRENGVFFYLALYWNTYNLLIIASSLLAFWEMPKLNLYETFALNLPVVIYGNNKILEGETIGISENTATILLKQQFLSNPLSKIVSLKISKLNLKSQVISTKLVNNEMIIKVEFIDLNLSQERQLIELLYCTPNRWKEKDLRKSPGELQSLKLIFKLFWQSLWLFCNLYPIRGKKASNYRVIED